MSESLFAEELKRLAEAKEAGKHCERCGYIKNLEQHHIKHRIEGGGDDPDNLKWLCRSCHDYQHAKDNVTEAIQKEKERLAVLEKRLALIESLNTPERLAKGEPYQSYFDLYSEALQPINTKCGRNTA